MSRWPILNPLARRLTWHPSGPATNVRHSLMFIPVVIFGQGLVDRIVKVGIVTAVAFDN